MLAQIFNKLRLGGWRISQVFALRDAAANESVVSDFRDISAANEYRADEKGWIQISPYGEFPHPKGLQVFQRSDADKIVQAYNSIRNMGRRLFGLPLYKGHPDADKASYPDDGAYARIKELDAREDGLYGRAEFSANGKALITDGVYDGHSPYWRFEHDKTRRGVIRPVELISVGLTNFPNIPVNPITAAALNEEQNMNEYLKKLAKLMGLDEAAANEAAIEAQIAKAMTAMNEIGQVRTKLTEAEGKVTTLTTDLTAANTALTTAKAEAVTEKGKVTALTTERDTAANSYKLEREARTKMILDTAINSTALTQAEKPGVEKELNEAKDDTAYNAVASRVMSKASQLFTTSIAQSRTAANGKASAPGWSKFHSAVNEMKAKGKTHNEAWNACKAMDEHKGLFADDQQKA